MSDVFYLLGIIALCILVPPIGIIVLIVVVLGGGSLLGLNISANQQLRRERYKEEQRIANMTDEEKAEIARKEKERIDKKDQERKEREEQELQVMRENC